MTQFAVKHIAERFGVKQGTVLDWIRSGDLTAINVGRPGGKRPRWRISDEAIADFARLRTFRPMADVNTKPVKARKLPPVKKFF